MADDYKTSGSTSIATDVLLTIAQLTTLEVPGVNRLTAPQNRLLIRGHWRDGVRIEVLDGAVQVDIYLILNHDVNVREVSHNIQNQVARAISEMVGMHVGLVNIHIEDIEYPMETEA